MRTTCENKISLIVLVYNHEHYIKEALLSFLQQEGDFEYQIILSNDCSKDKSDDIIRSVLDTHPKASLVSYYNQTKNLGLIDNFLFCMSKADGDYIALCGGDDYWIDHLKLQKQVNFLNSNKNYSAVAADTYYLENETYRKYTYVQTKASWLNEMISNEFSFAQIANRFFPHPNTILFRNGVKLPDDFRSYSCEDFPLFMLLADKGKIGFINEVHTVYRLHPESLVHSTKNVGMQNNIRFLKILFSINLFLNNKYKKVIVQAIQNELLRLFIFHRNKEDRSLLTDGVQHLEQEYGLVTVDSNFYLKLKIQSFKTVIKQIFKALTIR